MKNNINFGLIDIQYISWFQLYIQYLYFLPKKYNARIKIDFDLHNYKSIYYNVFIDDYEVIDENNIHDGAPILIDCGKTLIMFKKNRFSTEINFNKELDEIFGEKIFYDKSIFNCIYFIYDIDNPNIQINIFALYKFNNIYRFVYRKDILDQEDVNKIITEIFQIL